MGYKMAASLVDEEDYGDMGYLPGQIAASLVDEEGGEGDKDSAGQPHHHPGHRALQNIRMLWKRIKGTVNLIKAYFKQLDRYWILFF